MPDILFINETKALALNQEINGTLLLGTKLLAAGFDVKLLRFGQIRSYQKDYESFIRETTDRVLELQPKCISCYTVWPHFHMMLRIAREVKARAPHIITVFGGPQSTATAQTTMEKIPYVDYVCTGEGENTVVPFFQALLRDGGKGLEDVPGLYRRVEGQVVRNTAEQPLCDLDTLPYWDDRLYLEDYDGPEPGIGAKDYFMPLDAGRGCPYSCSFCCTSHFWRRTYRLKSPERIVADIRYFRDKFGIRSFFFAHDAFTIDKKLVTKVCDYMIEQDLGIHWMCSARVDCVTEELLQKMKQAGMVRIELGIETGSKRMQKLIHKNLDLDRARRMVKVMLDMKLNVSLFFMYGFPEETVEDLNDTLGFILDMKDMGVQNVNLFFTRFNPATEITVKYMDQLVLDEKVDILSRGVFGYEEELPVIRENKELFPFLYHLHSQVRDEYQYLRLFPYLYEQFPNSVKFLRQLYKGDDLRFYRDVVRCSQDIFDRGANAVVAQIKDDPFVFVEKVADLFDEPFIPQLKGLMRFVRDVQKIRMSREDLVIEGEYGFNFLDFKMRKPIEAYSVGRTRFRLSKTGGVADMKVVKIWTK